jgi:DNA-binding LacI/PurR family transcriptional regulator/anti-anti-sigma regulatory factor
MSKENQARHDQPRGERVTIGLLSDRLHLSQSYAADMQRGAIDKVRERDANLFCFVGGSLRSPAGFVAQGNVLYDLLGEENVDGLLILSGSLSPYVEPAEFAAFCHRYHPLPMVSVGLKMENIPSLTVENYAGMYEAVAHLIEVHGLERIAFIRGPEGNQEAEERYSAYVDALTEHGLAVDPDLVAPGDFRMPAGSAAISLLLDQRRVDLEAVVAANDDMALTALEALQARGRRVPRDVAVVGFDDMRGTECIPTPLTTVRQPMYEMGQKAVEMVLAQLAGQRVPEQVLMPARLVVRQSCGCIGQAVERMTIGPILAAWGEAGTAPVAQRGEILSAVVQALGDSESAVEEGERLLDAFLADLERKSPGAFLRALSGILNQAVLAGQDVSVWHEALLTLRRCMLPYLDSETLPGAADLWQQAQVLIGKAMQRLEAYQTIRLEQQTQALRELGQRLSTTFDVGKMVDLLADGLPGLGIPSAYLSLYENPAAPTEGLRLTWAYDETGCLQSEKEEGACFPSSQLVPPGLLPERQWSYVIDPLYFRERQLGIVLFEVGPQEGNVYEALRGEISSALQGALLLRERERARKALEKAYAEVEQQVQERTAELEREIEERERAQAESLRLQQEVIEAQQRAIQELSTPIIPVLKGVIVMPLIGSIDTLRARDVTRSLLAGIREHHAKVVILDITGVPIVDSGVAAYLNKTVQAARLKGARTIVTGISEAVAETIVDLGVDWSGIETLSDLRTGLRAVLAGMGRRRPT